jgi:hypothetical protein
MTTTTESSLFAPPAARSRGRPRNVDEAKRGKACDQRPLPPDRRDVARVFKIHNSKLHAGRDVAAAAAGRLKLQRQAARLRQLQSDQCWSCKRTGRLLFAQFANCGRGPIGTL